MEAEGSIATAVAKKSSKSVTVDKKAAFMVQELRKFDLRLVSLSGLGRSRWLFNTAFWASLRR